jgi:hypothetical protein
MVPAPLPVATTLQNRYRIVRPIGQGGFGITYLAEDLLRRDRCVVKELAPHGASRLEDGQLRLGDLGTATALRLRRQFLQEAETLRGISTAGILPVRDAFMELGTAYYVSSYVEGALSLDRLVARDGRLTEVQACSLLEQALDALEALHAKGLLHRDLKPSNILVSPNGRLYLIDFGSARVWHADLVVEHTVQFTPGYAPIEQMSERARRGPATDLYGLCASIYWALTGERPPPATDRAAGVPLRPLAAYRPDVSATLGAALEAGLRLRYDDRPADVTAFRALLGRHQEPDPAATLAELDRRRGALQRLRPGKRECPSCGGLLVEATPLRKGVCPVCRQGRLAMRDLPERLCAVCRTGVLREVDNARPLHWCPNCRVHPLRQAARFGRGRPLALSCPACGDEFAEAVGLVSRKSTGEAATWDEWRQRSGRARVCWVCDACRAQFDGLGDGRRRLVHPEAGKWRVLYPDEWARVAAGLDPGAGNMACSGCEAEFHAETDSITPLGARDDPYGFLSRYQGRLIELARVPWLAAGKTRGGPGLVCQTCWTELDRDRDLWLLVATSHPVLGRHAEQTDSIEGWRRRALELPEAGQEHLLDQALAEALREAYRAGVAPLDSRTPALLWSSPATRFEAAGADLVPKGSGQLTITLNEITHGGALRKLRTPMAGVEAFEEHDGLLRVRHEAGDLWFEPGEIELSAKLESGRVSVVIGLDDLLARLSRAGASNG